MLKTNMTQKFSQRHLKPANLLVLAAHAELLENQLIQRRSKAMKHYNDWPSENVPFLRNRVVLH